MFSDDVDGKLRELAADPAFPHRDAARHAIRFRESSDVADLVAVADDAHPCAMVDVIFALAVAERPWLNWVPMPGEALSAMADQIAGRRARGETLRLGRMTLTAPEPPSVVNAVRRILGPLTLDVLSFPEPDIRVPVRRGRYKVWRYDGADPVPAVRAPSPDAIAVLREVADEPWPSPLSGYAKAQPLGKFPLDDLLGLLVHLPGPPDTPRWERLATSTPTYWYRLLQPWVTLGILHHAEDEPWPVSTRREVLTDLAFSAEDWVCDAALFALVAAAYREPAIRDEVRGLVRARLDAAVTADRLVTIEESLAHLMLVTPGRTTQDRLVARDALGRTDDSVTGKRGWWRRWTTRR